MPDLDAQTRATLTAYLSGSMQTRDLERRLARLAWSLRDDATTAANPITAAASLFIAEYEAGHRDDTELHELFASLLGKMVTETSTTVTSIGFTTVRRPRRSIQLDEVGTPA